MSYVFINSDEGVLYVINFKALNYNKAYHKKGLLLGKV